MNIRAIRKYAMGVILAVGAVLALPTGAIVIYEFLTKPSAARLRIEETAAVDLLSPLNDSGLPLRVYWDSRRGFGSPDWGPLQNLNVTVLTFANVGDATFDWTDKPELAVSLSINGDGEFLYAAVPEPTKRPKDISIDLTRSRDGRRLSVRWQSLNGGDRFQLFAYHTSDKSPRLSASGHIPRHAPVSITSVADLQRGHGYWRWGFSALALALLASFAFGFSPSALVAFGVRPTTGRRRVAYAVATLLGPCLVAVCFGVPLWHATVPAAAEFEIGVSIFIAVAATACFPLALGMIAGAARR